MPNTVLCCYVVICEGCFHMYQNILWHIWHFDACWKFCCSRQFVKMIRHDCMCLHLCTAINADLWHYFLVQCPCSILWQCNVNLCIYNSNSTLLSWVENSLLVWIGLTQHLRVCTAQKASIWWWFKQWQSTCFCYSCRWWWVVCALSFNCWASTERFSFLLK